MSNTTQLPENWRSFYPTRTDSGYARRTKELISNPSWEPPGWLAHWIVELNDPNELEYTRTWLKGVLTVLPALLERDSRSTFVQKRIADEGPEKYYRRDLAGYHPD